LNNLKSFDDVIINFEISGTGDIPIIFIHGWNCSMSNWKDQVPYFSDEHTVVTIDLPGHGGSGKNRLDYSVQSFGKDIKIVSSHLGLKNIILVGHSMGGPICLQAAREMKGNVMAVIGVDILANFESHYSREAMESLMKPLRENYDSRMYETIKKYFVKPGTDEDKIKKLAERLTPEKKEISINCFENYHLWINTDYRKAIMESGVPIRCILKDSSKANFDVNRKYEPTYEVEYIKDVGHFIMMEKPNEFNEVLKNMISRL